MNLLKETQKLLKKTTLSLETVAKETGQSLRFIYRLRSDDCADFGVKKVQTVYDFLVKQ